MSEESVNSYLSENHVTFFNNSIRLKRISYVPVYSSLWRRLLRRPSGYHVTYHFESNPLFVGFPGIEKES